MILLLGGTSETEPIARAILDRGWQLLVSTATALPLTLPDSPSLQRRSGELDELSFRQILQAYRVQAVLDATHPYAIRITLTARAACKERGVAFIRYERPQSDIDRTGVHAVRNHEDAARLAFSYGQPVLLTTGSRHVHIYARESRRVNGICIARVLPDAASMQACRDAGIPEDCIIGKKGPFSVEQNTEMIRRHRIGILVTKDSGARGGVPEKLRAAEQAKCEVVLIKRPERDELPTFDSIDQAIRVLEGTLYR